VNLKIYEIAYDETLTVDGTVAAQLISYDVVFSDQGTQGVQGPQGIQGATGTSALTNQGDILYRNATVPDRLAIGTAGQFLKVNTGATAPQWVTIDKSTVGLGNVDNTSDVNKPVSTATQTALNLKANLASPTFTGTVSGITKSMVGLGNADNTSDANKPISTATQTALNGKANSNAGVPAGGTTGQVLRKVSNTNYDTEWGTGGGGSVTYGTTAGTACEGNDARIATIASGSINTMTDGGYGGNINTSGEGANFHAGGYIDTSAGEGGDGGYIDTHSTTDGAGGYITTAAGIANGGSINTSDGGGSINTRGTGSIELGVTGTRTTIVGGATEDRNISLPDADGEVVLQNTSPTFTGLTINGASDTLRSVNASGKMFFGSVNGNTGMLSEAQNAFVYDAYVWSGVDTSVTSYRPLVICASNSPQLSIHPNNRVGIGVAIPQSQLDVSGDITATSTISIKNGTGNGAGASIFWYYSEEDGANIYVDLYATRAGTVGNSIVLTLNGISSIGTIVNTWNTNNPNNTISSNTFDETAVLPAQTVTFSGGTDPLKSTIDVANLSASRTHNLPDASGTLALTTTAPASHAHGNITNAGLVGTTSGLPLKTGTGGIVEAGAFGTSAGQFAEGNHTHTQLHNRSHAITSTSDHTATANRVFYSDNSGNIQEVALGASGTILTSAGATSAPTFSAPAAGGSTNLWIPASAWIPRTTTGCGVDSREQATNKVNTDELLFDTASEEFAQALVVMPNNYNNSTLTARFYWTAASGSGGVAWGVSGRAYGDDDALDAASGTRVVVTDTFITANDVHVTSTTGAVTIAGTPAANKAINFQIVREVGNGSDTLGVDARLLGVEIIFN
jgi:hypothetical protein